jgi:NADH:ubiquinone oxidoreductase subunit 4 (subunit M)
MDMKRFAIGVLCALVGYAAIAAAGYFLVSQFSPNMHDRSVEAAMTAAFVFGPIGAILAFIGGFVYTGRGNRGADSAQ